jgi:outer membrane protein
MAAATLVVAVAPVQGADLKIGMVVTQNLLAGSTAGQEAFEKLKAKKEQAQEKLDSRTEELKEMEADLQKRAMVLSAEERTTAAEEFEKRQREGARLKEDLERDLKREEAEAMSHVNQFLSRIVVEYGQKNDYDLVLDATGAVYFSEAVDITAAIVEQANKEWKK